MNSLDRVYATIEGKLPDRVPTDLHNFLPATRMAGFSTVEGLQNGKLIAEAQLQAWEIFGHDALLVENGVVAEAEALGCEVRYFSDGPPRVVEPAINDLRDVENLTVPDPWNTFPLNELLKATDIIAKEVDDQAFVMGRADQGPFALAAALVGYEKIIKLAAKAVREETKTLEKLERLLNFCLRVNKVYAKAQIDAGAHGTSFGEMGADIIGPNIYKKLIYPFDKRLITELENEGIVVSLHICGDNAAIIDEMVDTGASILEVDHKPDKETLKEHTKGMTLLGRVNPEILAHASPELVENEVRKAINELAKEGNFISGPGCALGYETPKENIQALIRATKKYGTY